MAFQYLTNIPLDQAREEYRAWMAEGGFAAGAEEVPAGESWGRTTARAVYAGISAPHYLASAMDGIALETARTYGATETTPVTLPPGAFQVVDTGDPVPEGCDGVVMIEDVVWEEDGAARLHAPAVPWQHIRQVGEDICAGEMLLTAYAVITPAAAGAMLASGVTRVPVLKKPVVGIIPTGDEIVPPTDRPRPGAIPEFNSAIFSGMLAGWGAEPLVFPIVPDRPEALARALETALERCDIVLLGAGSSAGREDYAAGAIRQAREVLRHGIAIRPGKPAILGRRKNKPILGVPGYPVSGILVLEELLKPLLLDWYHAAPLPPETGRAVLSRPVLSGLKYQEFVRVRLGRVDGEMIATPLDRGSGMVTSFMKADGILAIPQGTEGIQAGSRVTVRLLRPAAELEGRLVITGSHDPLLDEAADLLRQRDRSLGMASSHVGSMGGIMAVRRGEAHGAGLHLLDEKDGSYNRSYLERYFPQGGIRLVECVGRAQGLMVAKGNPKGLRGVEDLGRPGVRYVNRQKGSGTRVLLDYLCQKAGVDTGAVSGYQREEPTHTAVAAQIAAGSGDAGLGILSAARLYDLDFLPVCQEQYDLLIPDSAWDTPMVRMLLEVMESEAFARRLQRLGGYTLEKPGQVRLRL